jgi:hypothetical protein
MFHDTDYAAIDQTARGVYGTPARTGDVRVTPMPSALVTVLTKRTSRNLDRRISLADAFNEVIVSGVQTRYSLSCCERER